jgi:hypothetical protein
MASLLTALSEDQVASEQRIAKVLEENCGGIKVELNHCMDNQELRINSMCDSSSAVVTRLDSMQTELDDLKQSRGRADSGNAPLVAAAGHAGPSGQPPPASGVGHAVLETSSFEVEGVPWRNRCVGILGGFLRTNEDDVVLTALEAFSKHWACPLAPGGVKVPCAFGSICKLVFQDPRILRLVVAKNRNAPYCSELGDLWFSVAKTYDERVRDRCLRSAKEGFDHFAGLVAAILQQRVRICYGFSAVVVGKETVAKWDNAKLELVWYPDAVAKTSLGVACSELETRAMAK